MTQAPAAVFKIPTESPQPVQGKAAKPSGRAKKVLGAGRSPVLGSGNGCAATRGGGEVIELECGITVYPARSEQGRWRAVWHEEGQRQQCEAATEDKLAAKLEKVKVRLEADAPKMRQPGAALIACYLTPDRLPVSERWSRKHAHSQSRLCALYAAPVIGEVTCQDIKTGHMQQIVNAAPTAGEGGLVGAAAAAWPAVALVGSYELLAWMIRTAAGGGPDQLPGADHGVPQADQPVTIRQPAVPQPREAVEAAACRAGASPEPESVHDWLHAACRVAPVHGPGPDEPACTDQTDHQGGPVRESTGPREPGGPTVPEPAVATVPAGDINAAAVAAYRASLQEGKPLSERKLAETFGRTSRRWARNRMAEARPAPVAG
jgi:hypothetical protein